MNRKAGYLQITRKCNNECIFCSNPSFEEQVSFFELTKQILDFKKDGINEIIITGGEPTTSEDLSKIIAYIKNENINMKLISNGIKLSDSDFVKKLYDKGLRDVNISVHSHIKEDYHKLSGNKGDVNDVLIGIKNCITSGINVNINTTLNSINSNYLSELIIFLMHRYPEVKHYVFNNLDPGKADGVITSRARKNSWIIPKLIEIEYELNKTLKLLLKNNKTFRVERVPLCYMKEFEEYSTETRKIVKDETYICYFIEKDNKNQVRKVEPSFRRRKKTDCKECFMDKLCSGLQEEYIELYGKEELSPYFDNPKIIKQNILHKNE